VNLHHLSVVLKVENSIERRIVMFREIKVGEEITDKRAKTNFNPDERIKNHSTEELIEVRIFDPDVRGCYRTIMVPVDAGAKD
jgi:hypothetical protein